MVQDAQHSTATPSVDTGNSRYDYYVVKPNDALSLYATNLLERNPELRERFPRLWGPNGFVMHLVRTNNSLPASERPAGWRYIRAANGRDCDGNPENSPKLHEGQVFVYDDVPNEILNPGEPCADLGTIERPQPVSIPRNPAPEVVEDVVRAKLPVYPTGGNLGNGNSARVQDWYNAPLIWTRNVPNQPVVAARGINPHGGSIQTIGGTAGAIAEHAALNLSGGITIPGTGLGFIPTGLMTSIGNPGDRTFQSRQGSNGALDNDTNAGRNARLDLPILGGLFRPGDFYLNPLGVTHTTRDEAHLLPGYGVQIDPATGLLLDTPSSHNNNNQLYYVTNQGEYAPGITTSETAERSRGIQQIDGLLQATPSTPQILRGLNNYSMAYFINRDNIEPQIATLTQQFQATPSRETAQEIIGLLNAQETLVGVSNFDVRRNVANPLGEADIAELNVRERIRYNRHRLLDAARERGITDLDPNFVPAEPPVRSQTRAELREKHIGYYDVLAENRPGVFRFIYREQTGERVRYGRRNDEERRAAATRFVDDLELIQTMPEQGVRMSRQMWDHISTQHTGFNDVERFELGVEAPVVNSVSERRDVIGAGLRAAFEDQQNVQLLLRNADYTPIAQAIAQRDNLSIELPAEFGARGVRLNRAGALAEVRRRGYSDEIIGRSMTREETHGILRNLPEVQRNIIASADNAEIVGLRQEDLLQLADHRQNGRELRRGALGDQLMHVLAYEPDSRTRLAIEANLRASGRPDAEDRIIALRRAVALVKENITQVNVGMTHTDIGVSVQAQELGSLAGEGAVVESGERRGVARVNNVAAITALAANAQSAPALLAAVGSNADLSSTALTRAASLEGEQRIAVARAALGSNSQSAIALVSSHTETPEAARTRFAELAAAPAALTAETSAEVLTTMAGVPLAARGGFANVAANPQLAPALLQGLSADARTADTVVGALTPETRNNLATLGRFEGNTWPADQETTVQVTRRPGPLDSGLAEFRTAAAIGDERSRATSLSRAFYNSPHTRTASIETLQRNNPEYMTALIVQTMAGDRQLRRRVEHNLDRAGDRSTTGALAFLRRAVDDHPAGELAGIIRELSEAYEAGNQREVAQRTAQLQRFVSAAPNTTQGRYHQLAVRQLYESMLAAEGGRDALTQTIVATIDRTGNVANQPLATSGHNADDTLSIFFGTALQADVGAAAQHAEEFVGTQWANGPVGGGISIPFVPVPRGRRRRPKDEDIPPGIPEACDDPTRCVPTRTPPRPPTVPVPPRPGG